MSLKEILSQTVIEESTSPVIFVNTDMSVTDVFKSLISNNVLSSPVWSEEAQQFVGIIDIMDILMLMIEVFSREELETFSSLDAIAAHSHRFNKEAFNEHFKNHKAFLQGARVDDMAGLSGVNRFVPINNGDSLWDALNVMVDNKLHRVAVMSGPKSLSNYVTQSRLLAFIHDHLDAVDADLLAKTMTELGIPSDDMITCNETDLATDVFSTMSRNGVSSVPIIDGDKKFSGCISASDLKGIGAACEQFPRLCLNVIDYIAPIRQQNLKSKFPAIGCTASCSLKKVIQKLVAARVHRLFVTDDDHHVVGVVSLGDVLRVLRDSQ